MLSAPGQKPCDQAGGVRGGKTDFPRGLRIRICNFKRKTRKPGVTQEEQICLHKEREADRESRWSAHKGGARCPQRDQIYPWCGLFFCPFCRDRAQLFGRKQILFPAHGFLGRYEVIEREHPAAFSANLKLLGIFPESVEIIQAQYGR
jgi:hypothetical protein